MKLCSLGIHKYRVVESGSIFYTVHSCSDCGKNEITNILPVSLITNLMSKIDINTDQGASFLLSEILYLTSITDTLDDELSALSFELLKKATPMLIKNRLDSVVNTLISR